LWELQYGLCPTNAADATANPDNDPHDNRQEYDADTDPTNPASFFHVAALSNLPPWAVYFDSSSSRWYTLQWRTNLLAGGWSDVPSQTNVPGTGGRASLTGGSDATNRFYRLKVTRP
jgi:hypothetical protein